MTHQAHCNQGEYIGGCKYGEPDCPMRPPAEELTHKHERETQFEGMESYISCITCGEMMFEDEIDRRLNATEELSAESADFLVGYWTTQQWFGSAEELQNAIDELRAYAERMKDA